jgi:hypothetical protein
MILDFDPDKSKGNEEKHGIDFEAAKALWDDSRAVGFPGRSDDEPRFAMIAELNSKLWVAFYTVREERIRIISVRRARKAERKLYES